MRKKIGEVLRESGLLTEEQLKKALIHQKGRHKRLGKILIELGFANEMEIAEALSKQLSLPLVDCSSYEITKELTSIVPKETAENKLVLPIEKKDRSLLLAMADPLDWQTIDEIAFNSGLKVNMAVSPEPNILDAIEKAYGSEEKTWDLLKEIPAYEGVEILKETGAEEKEEVSISSLYKLSEAPPIVKLVTMILVDAVKSRASDIHIEPGERFVQVRYRIDGRLKNILKYPKHIQDSVISRIKIVSNLDITNRRLPQDGRSSLKLEDKKVDLRISTLPSVYGEKIVIRLLDRSTGLISLEQLGMPETLMNPFKKIISRPQGMFLVTGPTGSGKTTTLYAILQQIRSETKNIITIEDPVEYSLGGITQVGVNESIGLSFSSALRSILRQDPDVIMVGEIRDLDTAEIAARSALTGHLVLSTVHTNDTVSTITRLLDIGLEPFLVSSAITAVLAQRLVRRICPECKEEVGPPEWLEKYSLTRLEKHYRGKGCKTCGYTGYSGRTGIFEFLRMSTRIKRLVAKEFTEDEVLQIAREEGTITLFEDAWAKVTAGITTIDEVLSSIPLSRELPEEEESEKLIRRKVLLYNVKKSDAEAIRSLLETEEYIVTVGREEDIKKLLDRETPDLIIVDISEHNGTSFQLIRDNIRYAYIPVIAIANLEQKEETWRYKKLGIHEFIFRPLNLHRLLLSVESILV